MPMATTKPAARARQLAALWIARNVADEALLARDLHPAELAEVRRELLALADALNHEAEKIERGGPA